MLDKQRISLSDMYCFDGFLRLDTVVILPPYHMDIDPIVKSLIHYGYQVI